MSDNGPCTQLVNATASSNTSAGHRQSSVLRRRSARRFVSKITTVQGAGARHRSVCGVLHTEASTRGHRQPDAGRHVPRSPACDPAASSAAFGSLTEALASSQISEWLRGRTGKVFCPRGTIFPNWIVGFIDPYIAASTD